MPNLKANGIQIEYDTFGTSSSPALLLIIGLGGQMIQWDEAMCEDLATRGHYVVRFDNRDSGLSTKFEEAGIPDVVGTINALLEGKTVESPYTLEDMADDAIGLLDALNIDKAHICGMSMGGMRSTATTVPAVVGIVLCILLPRFMPTWLGVLIGIGVAVVLYAIFHVFGVAPFEDRLFGSIRDSTQGDDKDIENSGDEVP